MFSFRYTFGVCQHKKSTELSSKLLFISSPKIAGF